MQRYRRKPQPLPPVDRLAQGEHGERLLQDWLDRSGLPYVFVDQTPLTIPLAHRAQLNRPDFLIPMTELGSVAVDAKAKNLIDGEFVIDEYERRALAAFQALFNIPVWFACFP